MKFDVIYLVVYEKDGNEKKEIGNMTEIADSKEQANKLVEEKLKIKHKNIFKIEFFS